MVLDFQAVILIPKSRWMKAIKAVNKKEANRHFTEKLFILIGKLQSFEHENTKGIVVPDKYKAKKAIVDPEWISPETLSKEDELLLIEMLDDIVGEEHVDQELEMFLNIINEDLEIALNYTKRD